MSVTSSHRQAITTKYIGPSNVRGSRVKASCDAGTVTVSWDHALNSSGNHEYAARVLLEKLGWSGEWVGGCDKDGNHVFVNVDTLRKLNLSERLHRLQRSYR